jgi:hypothetical protein
LDVIIPFTSFFRKLLFATYFGDEKIFFSSNISTASKLLIRRNITDGVKDNALTLKGKCIIINYLRRIFQIHVVPYVKKIECFESIRTNTTFKLLSE